MKLHEIPEGSTIKCETSDGSKFITFHHLDGMYSYCTTERGGVTNLSRMTPIIKRDGYYEFCDLTFDELVDLISEDSVSELSHQVEF